MVDINIASENLGANVMSGIQTGAVWTTVGLILLGIVALFMWQRYVKSFNHMVIIKRPVAGGGFELDYGYKGRFIFKKSADNNSKKVVFQIFQARKKKLSYNEESDCYKHRIPCMVAGRRKYLVILEPNSEGFLQPVSLNDNSDSSMMAVLNQADLASYEATLKEIANKYDQQDFMQKYGLMIYIIMILVIAALYWWGSRNMSKAMETIAQALNANTAATAEVQKLALQLINGTIKNPSPPVILG